MTAAGSDRGVARRLLGKAASQSVVLRLLPVLVIAAGLSAGYVLGLDRYLSLHALIEQRAALSALVTAHRFSAALIFLAVYAAAVALSFPAATIMTIVGGFLFGWLLGGVLAVVAATLGAAAIFTAARFALRNVLKRRAAPWLARLADGFERNAFGYLLALRLAPVVPVFVVNLAPAFFEIGLRSYVAATFIGILPGTFAYAWLGAGLDSAIAAAAGAGREATLSDLVTPEITAAFLALAAIALFSALFRTWRARHGR
ncbi:MAG: TVP38/TMEM64 family protein [Pararhizobium sp.]